MEENFVKIVIDLPDAEDGVTGEGIWSVQVGQDLYELRNSPWHTLEMNFGDVVRAISPAEDKKPVVTEVVHRSGHRSIHIRFLDEDPSIKKQVIEAVKAFGANYENADGTTYAIDLRPNVEFGAVADYLQECETKGWLSYRHAPQPQPMGTGDAIH
jgi:hypothetical protein